MYALAFVVLSVWFVESLQKLPECPDMGNLTLSSTIRDQLFNGIRKRTSIPYQYNCELEVAGIIILEDPEKGFDFLHSSTAYPLIFNVTGRADNVKKASRQALQFWERYFPLLDPSKKFVGCGYVYEEDYHKYMCLFDES